MRFLLTILLLTLLPAAKGWELRVGALRTGGAELRSIQVQLTQTQMTVRAASGAVVDLGIKQTSIAWDCTLERSTEAGTACSGSISARSPAWRGTLQISSSPKMNQAVARIGEASLHWQSPAATSAQANARIRLSRIPLSWVQQRLTAAWPDLASLSGFVDADFQLAADADKLSGRLALKDVAFEAQRGEAAAAALQLQGNFSVQLGARPALQWRVVRPLGQVLLGPVYFELPAAESALEVSIVKDERGAWQLPALNWHDGEGLRFKAAAHFDESDRMEVHIIEMSAALDAVSKRYLGTALATAGFEALQLQGQVQASGRFFDGAWRSFDLKLQQVSIADPAERIQVGQLDGVLRLDPGNPINSMHWTKASVYKIPLGDGHARWNWSPDTLQLAEPLSIALLGGTLRITALQRTLVAGHAQWRGAIELDKLDVLNLTTALDWPNFSGSLSGSLPGFRFQAGGFSADGDIQLSVFDGQMRISGLNSERSFGVAPSMGANIELDNLDLKQLSSMLDFGEIEGWLDGEVKGLRMLDWAPIAFDARLHTDTRFPRKKRISQRAVQGLSSVGGGGSVMGNPLMKLVDSFAYTEIGLNCRLVDNVCEMGGLDTNGAGYTILRGAGLPRLTVVGHQRRVDWPVLLSRLQAVSSGQAPVIE